MDGNTQRFVVFAVEMILTYSLIIWMRNNQRAGREPWSFILKILAFGALTAIISAIVQLKYSFQLTQITHSSYGSWLEALNNLSSSMIEELGKYMIGVFTLLSTRHTHKMSDVILYLVVIGLGFSLVEDAIYLTNPHTIPALRLMSFYLHSGTSAIIGYSLGRYKFGLAGHKELFVAVFSAIGLHFLFNTSTTLSDPSLSFVFSFALALFITLQIFILFRRTLLQEYGLEMRAQRLHHMTLLNTGHLE